MQALLLLLAAVGTVYPAPEERSAPKTDTCGYDSCPATLSDVLNVHIVPHTHDDVGWLKTVDQYYYGSKNSIQKAGVQYILDSVVKELWEDPKRRFIYVETAFFWKWWVRQSAAVQSKVHTLVRQGRLQMVGGAWSMNDEAASHYQSTVDQFTYGLKKLNQTFGHCGRPHVGWQIDPFGHSREFASLLAMMGYDGLFLGRIDYQDKRNRLLNRNMEMVWRGDDVLGRSSDIFTGVLHNTYSPPAGFCFDVLCADEPIIDDPDSPMYNVESKVDQFLSLCRNISKQYISNNILITMGDDFNYQDAAMWFINLDKLIERFSLSRCGDVVSEFRQIDPVSIFLDNAVKQAKYYRTNNVIFTMGGDFTYQDANMWYTNLDKLIQYGNLKAAKDKMNITLFYSTPNCYLKAIKDANPTLPTKKDDFFPYASDSTAYWTGYFTSRPTTKYFEREGNSYLQMVKQLQVLANLEKHNEFVLNELRSAMGVMQHHDAITGTEKQHVTHDYERLLNQAIDDALTIAKQAFNKVTLNDESKPPLLAFQRCHLNESSCHVSENSDRFIVTIYNPLGFGVREPIRIPVGNGQFEVYSSDGKLIKIQMVPIAHRVRNIPTRRSKATQEIVFITDLKPLSYKSIYIKKVNRTKRSGNTYDFYSNINNNFWGHIKEPVFTKIDDKQTYKDIIDEVTSIPFAPVHSEDISLIDDRETNLDILKDGKNDAEVLELEKFLKDNRRKDKDNVRIVDSYPNFNEDEMRMLADEPRTVEKFDDELAMENQFYNLQINTASGFINQVTLPEQTKLNFSINMFYYSATCGDNQGTERRSSGAYIFRPLSYNPVKLDTQRTEFVNGDLVTEFRVNLSPGGYVNTKLYDGLNFIETEWIVGPINIDDLIGKEYVMKYQTNIVNNGEFYTDSNGRQMLKRKLNFRPQWNVTLAEPISGNYYPVTNEIYIEGENLRLTILPDRSEGGSSLIEGEIELMLHRRLLCDDAFGVGEALNETANGYGLVVRGKHRIMIGKDENLIKKNVLGLHLGPQLLFSDAENIKFDDWLKLNNDYSFLNKELPYGLHLLTLEPWDSKILIRLENYLDNNEVIEVDLKNLFKNITIKCLRETMLAANMFVDEYDQWVWNKEPKVKNFDKSKSSDLKVKLRSKQIRTFIATVEDRKNSKKFLIVELRRRNKKN